MIKCNFGTIEIEGTRAEIYADFCTIIFSIYNDDVLSKEEIEKAVESATISREEAQKQAEEKAEELFNRLKMRLKEME